MLSSLWKLIKACFTFFNTLSDEQKKALIDAISDAYDAILRAFYKDSQNGDTDGGVVNA
ncbi:hypothetical protein RNA47_000181 [Morganella morganii]|nr:hypothetical protein [Morganella morganii]